jgi:branched-chain amino acid transport system substrate-binding protein
VKFLGVGDMTSDSPTLEALGDRALGAITVLNYSTALDNPANKAFLAAYSAALPRRRRRRSSPWQPTTPWACCMKPSAS